MKNSTSLHIFVFSALFFCLSGCGTFKSGQAFEHEKQALEKDFILDSSGPKGTKVRIFNSSKEALLTLGPNLGKARPESEHALITLNPAAFTAPHGFKLKWRAVPDRALFANKKIPLELIGISVNGTKIFSHQTLNGKIWASYLSERQGEIYVECDPRIPLEGQKVNYALTFSDITKEAEKISRHFNFSVNNTILLTGKLYYAENIAPNVTIGLRRFGLKRFIGQALPAQSVMIDHLETEKFPLNTGAPTVGQGLPPDNF